MKKNWRSYIAGILCVCLMIPITLPTVSAAEMTVEQAAQKGADVYEAWHIIKYSNYQYLLHKYQTPFRMEVENHQKDPVWNAMLTAWRTATFDVSSEVTYAQKEIAAYQAFIFNILYDENSSSLMSALRTEYSDEVSAMNKEWKKVSVSTWKKVNKAVAEYVGNKPIDLRDEKVAQKVVETLKTCGDLSGTFEIIGDCTEYLDKADSVLDLVEKLSKVEAVLQTSEEAADILNGMYMRSPAGSCLAGALKDFKAVLQGTLTKQQIDLIVMGRWTAEEAAEEIAKEFYKGVTKSLR